MLSCLPPVGHAVALTRSDAVVMPLAEGYRPTFVQAGTAALALALQQAALQAAVADPQVLIPAYACPDLVSAAVFAGVRPVLVDLEENSTYLSLAALKRLLNPSTVAVIAVNFLGIPERLGEIAELLREKPVALIEDNAQWFPPVEGTLTGDFAILSFGRGKPVSLLGGGALLRRMQRPASSLVKPIPAASGLQRLSIFARFLFYNSLRQPLFYGLLQRLPVLELGTTKYKPLKNIEAMDDYRLSYLTANVERHLHRDLMPQQHIHAMLQQLHGNDVVDLVSQQNSLNKRLLRYPLLIENAALRDEYLEQLQESGVGASEFYGRVLTDISGVGALVDCPEPVENARSFANRLLTLPVHDLVKKSTIARIFACFNA